MPEAPVLSSSELSCGYSPEAPVLKGVDLAFARGEVVAILGGSGSGKSTLLRTLGGLVKPLSGSVRLFEEPLYEVSRERRNELLRRTATVFQHDALFGSMTLEENVALPLEELVDAMPRPLALEIARAKLAMVDLAEVAHSRPSEVSGGQRKRAALARAIALDPEVVLCDEPTAGLDPRTAARVDRLLVRIRDAFGVTIVAVTHDVDSVRTIADRAIVLDAGRIRTEGEIAELEDSDDTVVWGFFHRVDRESGPREEMR